jgi:hypothetical protein
MTRRTGWTTSALLRAPLPKADLATLRVFVEWRRQRMAIADLARRSGYAKPTCRTFLSGHPVRHQAAMVRDLGEVLGI